MLEYPRNVVWYVEAKSAESDKSPSMGSAVAVRLRDSTTNNDRTYLLTCLHVICHIDQKTNKVLGLKDVDVTCFPPGEGTDSPQKVQARVASALSPIPDDLIGRTIEIAEDWVLLDVGNINFQKSAPFVRQYHDGAALEVVDKCRVIGYPGGRNAFSTGVVQNLDESHSITRQGSFNHWIVDSKGERAGASGGGVFAPDKKLMGIHRSRYGQATANYVVPVASILSSIAGRVEPVTHSGAYGRWPERLREFVRKHPVLPACAIIAALSFGLFLLPRKDAEEAKLMPGREILVKVRDAVAPVHSDYESGKITLLDGLSTIKRKTDDDIEVNLKRDGRLNIGLMRVFKATHDDGVWFLDALPAEPEYQDKWQQEDKFLYFRIEAPSRLLPQKWQKFIPNEFRQKIPQARFDVLIVDVDVNFSGTGMIHCIARSVTLDEDSEGKP